MAEYDPDDEQGPADPGTAAPAEPPATGYALAISTGPDDYILAGNGVQVTFGALAADSHAGGAAVVVAYRLLVGITCATPPVVFASHEPIRKRTTAHASALAAVCPDLA